MASMRSAQVCDQKEYSAGACNILNFTPIKVIFTVRSNHLINNVIDEYN